MTEETRIKFMTDGVLLKEIQKVRCSSRLVSGRKAGERGPGGSSACHATHWHGSTVSPWASSFPSLSLVFLICKPVPSSRGCFEAEVVRRVNAPQCSAL